MTTTGRAAPGGRHRPGWALPDATAPVAALAASLLGLILVGALAGGLLRQAGPTGLVDQPAASFVVAHRQVDVRHTEVLATTLSEDGKLKLTVRAEPATMERVKAKFAL